MVSLLQTESLTQLASLIKLLGDVKSTNKLTVSVDLRICRPVRVFLETLTHFLITKDVK